MSDTRPQFDRNRNGSLFDRGSADSYYQRQPKPHWYPNGTYKGEAVTNLTDEEIAEYYAGWRHNEASGSFKDWGD